MITIDVADSGVNRLIWFWVFNLQIEVALIQKLIGH